MKFETRWWCDHYAEVNKNASKQKKKKQDNKQLKKKNEETQMFNILPNDCRCDFCGKGPFKGYAGLRRHITHTPTCHKKSQQEFGLYAGGIWEDGLTIQQHLEGLKDTSTEHDLSQGTLDIEVENFGIRFDEMMVSMETIHLQQV